MITMMTFLLFFGLSSCSSSDGEENEKGTKENLKMESSIWSSEYSVNHDLDKYFKNSYEKNTVVLKNLNSISGWKYVEETNTDSAEVSINLCEKANHEKDCDMTLAFQSGKCKIEVSYFQTEYKAIRVKSEKKYRFEEGSYLVRTGPSSYETIKVYSYGIYRANGNLYIPLDGDGCVVIESECKYKGLSFNRANLVESEFIADYTLTDNMIQMEFMSDGQKSYFTCFLTDDEMFMDVPRNPFFNLIRKFRKI